MAPQALQTIGRLVSNPQMAQEATDSPEAANRLLDELDTYSPLRAAALYGPDGKLLAQLQHGEPNRPAQAFPAISKAGASPNSAAPSWCACRAPGSPPGHLLLVASSELPTAFYTGTLTASLGILVFSVLLWMIIARQIKRLITQPIYQLEQLTRQVTREENYALRAGPGNHDEIGSLAEAFNTMLSRIEAREQQLKRARDEFQRAFDQAQGPGRGNPPHQPQAGTGSAGTEQDRAQAHRLPELPEQHYRLHALGADRPGRAALCYPMEPGSQRALRDATGRSAEPADLPCLRTAQAVPPAAQGKRGETPRGEDRAGDLDPRRRHSPLCPDLLSADGRWRPRGGDPHRRHHPAPVIGGNDGAVGKDALRRWSRRRHGPRDQQPAGCDPAQRAEHPPAPVAGPAEEPRKRQRDRYRPGHGQPVPGDPPGSAVARRHPAGRCPGGEDRHPHAQLQPPQQPPDGAVRPAGADRPGGGDRRQRLRPGHRLRLQGPGHRPPVRRRAGPGAGHRQRAGASAAQPAEERRSGHSPARRRPRAGAHYPAHPAEPAVGGDPGGRQWRRHARGRAQAHVRAVLHHQGDRPGHWSGPVRVVLHHHQQPQGPDGSAVDSGPGHLLHPAPAAGRRTAAEPEQTGHRLFDLGGELAMPSYQALDAAEVERLEAAIDRWNEELGPLENFILPGGSMLVAQAHVCRSLARSAERRCQQLNTLEPLAGVGLAYINRLSDLLFVAARLIARRQGIGEILWQAAAKP
ncbi:hypothetical protein L1887_60076 [Cichorium endivia]|nr:hypothetical protein L1887_60076 [Cichorium endivia]